MKSHWFPVWIFPMILCLAIGTVWLRLAIVRTTYEIHQTEKILKEFQLEKEQLELKYAALKSPRRLELLAKSRFGLSPPRADQVIYLHANPSPSR